MKITKVTSIHEIIEHRARREAAREEFLQRQLDDLYASQDSGERERGGVLLDVLIEETEEELGILINNRE